MTEQRMILNRLLDKYENSRHLSEPGASTRPSQLLLTACRLLCAYFT